MRNYLIGGLMIAATVALVFAGKARAQEAGQPVFMTGFICESETDVRTMLDKMVPDLDWDQAKERAQGTSCAFSQKAGILKSMDGEYTNAHGDLFKVIAVTSEDKTLYTWRLMKVAVAL